jgi:hypothetical protein
MMKSKILCGVVIAVLTASAAQVDAQSASPQQTAPVQPAEPAVIDGYRSAHFGMTEADVKKAIKSDFGVSDPVETNNGNEHTAVLLVSGKTLIPESPPATISYIFGANTSKLIQVNIVWGDNGGADVGQIVSTTNALTGYFGGKGSYAKDSFLANQKMPDGSILAFRGGDAKGHMILLHLVPFPEQTDGKTDAKKDGKDKPVEIKKAMLELSYIADPVKPDIFHIEKGQF